MMNLSVMRDLLESKTHQSFIYSVLENWGYEPESVHFLRASSNFIYTFEKNNRKYILRLTPEKNINDLNTEVSFLNFLSDNNVQVNKPVKSRNGNTIERMNSSLGLFYAVVFNFFEGKHYEIEELNDNHFVLWGEALGNLHYYSRKFSSSLIFEKYTFIDQLNRIDHYLPSNEVEARNELELLRNWIGNLERTEHNFGRIHFDFELDNLIWTDDNIQIIDFESGIDGWYTADIAFALRDLFDYGVDLSNKLFQLFLIGYRKKIGITDQEIAEIPIFIRLHNLITFAKLLQTLDIDSSADNPQWILGLKTKLESKITEYRLSFKR